MELHPSIEKLIATAPTSAVAAAIGRDASVTSQLDPFAGVRLIVYVQDQCGFRKYRTVISLSPGQSFR